MPSEEQHSWHSGPTTAYRPCHWRDGTAGTPDSLRADTDQRPRGHAIGGTAQLALRTHYGPTRIYGPTGHAIGRTTQLAHQTHYGPTRIRHGSTAYRPCHRRDGRAGTPDALRPTRNYGLQAMPSEGRHSWPSRRTTGRHGSTGLHHPGGW